MHVMWYNVTSRHRCNKNAASLRGVLWFLCVLPSHQCWGCWRSWQSDRQTPGRSPLNRETDGQSSLLEKWGREQYDTTVQVELIFMAPAFGVRYWTIFNTEKNTIVNRSKPTGHIVVKAKHLVEFVKLFRLMGCFTVSTITLFKFYGLNLGKSSTDQTEKDL